MVGTASMLKMDPRMAQPPAKKPRRSAGLMVRDALTGVYSKVALLERLEEEVHCGQRYGDSFSLLLLDLDHFKSINDAFGHARGDATLTEFVARVQATARNSDVLFRYGGDEFVLFLPRTTHEHAAILADRLVAQIAGATFPGQPPLSLTVSAGLATLPDDGSSAEELLARADARMYEAKRGGRARVVSVDPQRDAELLLDEGARLIERLDALERANRFFDGLPAAHSGVLRIAGPTSSGRSRLLREIEKLAGLRGHRVISICGQRRFTLEPLSALREASVEAAALPPTLNDPAEVAEALRRALTTAAVVTITIDEMSDVDRPTLEIVRSLLADARAGIAIGVAFADNEYDTGPASVDAAFHDTIELKPLSRDGVRAWMRGLFRWEPPAEFIDWLHYESSGLPGSIRRAVLMLVERRVLVRDQAKWSLSEGFPKLAGAQLDAPMPGVRGVQPPRNTLIGRESAVRQLLRLLRNTRLISVVSPDGSGKTRLAVDIAFEAVNQLRDGVAFVSLGHCTSELEVASAIATTLEVDLPTADPWIALARALRARQLLLVLDDYAHLPGAPTGLTTLLQHTDDLRILVTARQRLYLRDEFVFHLDGLRVPKWPDPERARGFSAVQLFVERASLVNPHFALGEAEAASVSRICSLLDGAPLAIAIAAAQTASLSCREIANDVETALDAFSSYLPSAPPEQQGFRAIMDLAWRMLSEDERSMLRRASIFVADFDATAASKVMGAEPVHIDALIARSVLIRNTEGRLELHSLVREYAQQKLNEFRRDRVELSVTFSTHYLEVVRTAGTQLNDESTVDRAVAQLDLDLANVRRSWMIALADRDFARLVHAVRTLHSYFELRRFHADAETMFRNALDWVGNDGTTLVPVDDELTRYVLARHGVQLLRIGRIEEARRQLNAALSIARLTSNFDEVAFCLGGLAQVELAAGDPLLADEHVLATLAAARESQSPYVLGLALRDSALVAAALNSLETAVGYLTEATEMEVASTFRRDAWRGLLELGKQFIARANVSLGIATLSRISNYASAGSEVRLEATRVIGYSDAQAQGTSLAAISMTPTVETRSATSARNER